MGGMGIESILVSRPLPEGNFGPNPVIDTHRYNSRNRLRHRFFKRVVPDACVYTRESVYPRERLRSSLRGGHPLISPSPFLDRE